MLVFCEECAKKYTIDETRIKGDKARFSCRECGHIIVVEKPEVMEGTHEEKEIFDDVIPDEVATPDSPEKDPDKKEPDLPVSPPNASNNLSSVPRGKGISISLYLLLTTVIGFILLSGTFAYIHIKSMSGIIDHQTELRAVTTITALKGIISDPLLKHQYQQVNAEILRFSKLHGIAYAAVINKSHLVLAGSFNDLERFDKNFADQVRKKGFPLDILTRNPLPRGVDEASASITVGGRAIYDKVISMADTGDEIHVGMYATKIEDAIRDSLFAPLSLMLVAAVLFISVLLLIMVSKSLTQPLQELTDVTNRISLGEMDLTIQPHGPRELRELASALDRMCRSIKTAMQRLKE